MTERLIASHRGNVFASEERYCPSCGTVADRVTYAPPGWYRCPECDLAMPFKELARRTRERRLPEILRGPGLRFPVVDLVGTATSTSSTPAILTTETITAGVGDQLIAQVNGRRDLGVDSTVSVSWGTADINMLAGAFSYNLAPGGISYGRCMRHIVAASQSATMSFNFSGTVPDRRAIAVIRIRYLQPLATQFDDVEEQSNYPYQLTTTVSGDFFVFCHGQHVATIDLPRVEWDNQLTYHARLDVSGITNSILTTHHPVTSPITVRAISGPTSDHGTGFFGLRIQT